VIARKKGWKHVDREVGVRLVYAGAALHGGPVSAFTPRGGGVTSMHCMRESTSEKYKYCDSRTTVRSNKPKCAMPTQNFVSAKMPYPL
jgi:hypothetical protein